MLGSLDIYADKINIEQKYSYVMERLVHEISVLAEFIDGFVRIIEKHVKYIIVSGFVAIAHGRTRGTEDIDIIIEKMKKEDFIKMHDELIKNNFECMQSSNPEEIYGSYLEDNASIRYIKKDVFFPQMEVKFAKDALDKYQLKTRKKLPMTKLDVYFSSIEMNIAFKEELLKSDKDLEDAKHLRIVYGKDIDETEINEIKKMIRRLRLNDKR